MSEHTNEASQDELASTKTPGFVAPAQRDVNELAQLDADDESLQRWKKSLGIVPGSSAGGAKPSVRPFAPP